MINIDQKAHDLALKWVRTHPYEDKERKYATATQESLARAYYSAYWTILQELARLDQDPDLERLRSSPASM